MSPRSKKKRTLVWSFLFIAVGAVMTVIMSWEWLGDNRLPNVKENIVLNVRPANTVEDVLAKLEPAVKRPGSLKRAFREHQVRDYMKPGHYEIKKGSTSVYITRMLNNGWQTEVSLTISGSLRRKGDIAAKISSQMLVDSLSMLAALNDASLLKSYGFTPQTVWAMIIPDTYKMYWNASPKDILDRQKKAYDAFWTKENKAKAKALGLTQLEVSILASIVKGESNYQPDFAKLAGVYINRLRVGMRLQSCPTVAYVFDYRKNRILEKDLKVKSPYNTYINDGLPPGPICVPDKAYLEAVLNPDTRDGYLYFAAAPSFDGTHRFAKSFKEHSKNGREYQKAFEARYGKK